MSKSVNRLLALIVMTTLVGAAAATPASSGMSHGKPIKKHKMHLTRGLGDFQPSGRAWIGAGNPSGTKVACPRMGRSFECDRWPPPIDEDPDRVISGSAGD
jgi:hypothetical protein